VKILYVCEFCGNRSERRSVIEDCEKQGRPVGDELPPVGLIWIGRGNKGWREWPDAPPPGPVLDRVIAACRKAGVTPLILRGGEALPV